MENKNSDNYKKGIIYIIVSAFCFAMMGLFIRLSGDVPVFQKCFFRNSVALMIASAAIIKSGHGFKIGEGNLKYLIVRAAAGTIGLMCNFYAIDHIPISDASMLNKLSPFFAIIFSYFVLKEKANIYEWLAVLTAFAGALLVVKPGFNIKMLPALLGVIGGCGAGLAYTYVRKLGMRGENSMIIVFFFSAFSTICTLPYTIFNFTPMEPVQWVYLWLCGVSAAGGQIFITRAYSCAPAREISVYDFSIVIFSALLGFVFLEQLPDLLSVAGYVIIIGTAVIKWYYSMRGSEKWGDKKCQ